MVQVFLDDGGRDQLTVAHRLVILIVVGQVGLLQLLPKLNEEAGDGFDHRMFVVLVKEVEDDFLMVFHDFGKGLDAQLPVMFTEILEDLLQHVGCLSHSRHHQEDVFILVLRYDILEVSDRFGILHRGAAEFIDFLDHWILMMNVQN